VFSIIPTADFKRIGQQNVFKTRLDASKERALNSIRARQNKSANAEDYKRIWLCHVLNSKLKGEEKKKFHVAGLLHGEIDQPKEKFFEMSAIVYCFCHIEWLAEIAVVAVSGSICHVLYVMRDVKNTQFYALFTQSAYKKIINSNMSFRVTILYIIQGN